MIVFDLHCSNDHTFEAWFRDSKTYDRQRRKGEIVCPVCADTKVEKALMAPNVSTSRGKDVQGEAAPNEVARRETARNETARNEMARNEMAMAAEARRMLVKLRRHVEQNCDYVGSRFAEEARKMHHGEADKRDIYGEATGKEAAELREDGIEFAEIPWLPAEN